MRKPFSYWLWWLLASACLLSLRGLIWFGFPLSAVTHDFGPYLIIICFGAMGTVRRFWQEFLPILFWLFIAAVVINLAGLTGITTLVSQYDPEKRVVREIEAYQSRTALDMWVLLLFSIPLFSIRRAIIILGGVLLVGFMQVVFQKRWPVTVFALTLMLFLLVLPHLSRQWHFPWIRTRLTTRMRWLWTSVTLMGVLVAVWTPYWLVGQAKGLGRRFTGESKTQHYGEGRGNPLYVMLFENERLIEARLMLGTFTAKDWAFGRAFGGYYAVPAQASDYYGIHPGVWLGDQHIVGRRSVHAGVFMPLFKGGLLFAMIFFAGIGWVTLQYPRIRGSPLKTAAYLTIFIWMVHTLQGGCYLMVASLSMATWAASLGACAVDGPLFPDSEQQTETAATAARLVRSEHAGARA